MRAVVYLGPEDFDVLDVPDPEPGDGEVRIAVERVGVCGTDLHVHHSTIPVAYPVIPGHEIVGVIDVVGSGVEGVEPGERVVVDPNMPCGVCVECRREPGMQCLALRSFGVNAPGGLAELMVVPRTHILPARGLPPELAVFAEPVACVLSGAERVSLRLGDAVLVLGAGPSGLVMAQALRNRGAARVVVAAPPGPKLDLASAFGADETVELMRDDIVGSVGELLTRTGGRGYDVVVDVTGAPTVAGVAQELVAPSGTVMLYGVAKPDDRITIRPYDVYRRDLTILGSFAQSRSLAAAVDVLVAGRIDPHPLVTHEFALEDWGCAVQELLGTRTVHKAVVDVRRLPEEGSDDD